MTSKRLSGIVVLAVAGMVAVAVVGYFRSAGSGPVAPTTPHGHHGGHAVGMSGGLGVEMELTLDEQGRRMVIYVQKSGTHEPHALSVRSLDGTFEADGSDFDVKFEADPRTEDPPGRSSRFAVGLDKLPQQLIASNRFLLRLSYVADGRTFDAAISHSNDHTHEYHHD